MLFYFSFQCEHSVSYFWQVISAVLFLLFLRQYIDGIFSHSPELPQIPLNLFYFLMGIISLNELLYMRYPVYSDTADIRQCTVFIFRHCPFFFFSFLRHHCYFVNILTHFLIYEVYSPPVYWRNIIGLGYKYRQYIGVWWYGKNSFLQQYIDGGCKGIGVTELKLLSSSFFFADFLNREIWSTKNKGIGKRIKKIQKYQTISDKTYVTKGFRYAGILFVDKKEGNGYIGFFIMLKHNIFKATFRNKRVGLSV